MTPEWMTAVATVVGVVVGFGAVLVAYWQLGNLNATLRTNSLMVVLQIESEINGRKEKLDEATIGLQKLHEQSPLNDKMLTILMADLASRVENYLNALDRLAFCIKRNYVPEKDWRAEYRSYLQDAIKTYESNFGPSTRYRNIMDLNEKWQRE